MKRKFSCVVTAILAGSAMTGVAVAGDGTNSPDSGNSTPGNNLSFPVLYAEGVAKALRGSYGAPVFDGAFWYYWETEAEPLADEGGGIPPEPEHGECLADPDNTLLCDDGVEGKADGDSPPWDAVVVYPQQDADNEWQAEQADNSAEPLDVHWIDWGDALESVDWNLGSQVRAEVVLTQDLAAPMLEFEMKHLQNVGIDELWGTTGIEVEGMNATVYSPCARFTIQRLLVERGDPALDSLVWVPYEGWLGADVINPPIFNYAIHESGQEEDPEAYNAEINIKGKIIYGYTWNVRNLNEGAGDYRMTFSFDPVCDIPDDPETPDVDESQTVDQNAFFTEGVTQILPMEEEEEPEEPVATEGDETNNPTGGAVALIDFAQDITYADVRVEAKTSGGGGGGGGNGGGGNPNR